MESERLHRAIQNDFKSEFLENEQNSTPGKECRSKMGDTLKDWEAGDTVMSVAFKRICNRLQFMLDPDTYTNKQKKQMQKQAQLYNVYIFLTLSFTITPIAMYIAFTLPRIQSAKRQFYMHQYEKMNLLQRTLGIRTNRLDLKSLKDVLHKKEDH